MHLLLLLKKSSEVVDLYTKSDFSLSGSILSYKYTKVAAIKQCAIAGTAYEAQNLLPKALSTYEMASTLVDASVKDFKEALLWAEMLYFRFAMLATSTALDRPELILSALGGYQQVMQYMLSFPTPFVFDSGSVHRQVTLLNVHFMYLSNVLGKNPDDMRTKAELKNVSKSFEDVLFKSTAEISANSSNAPIEQFVDVQFKNWQASVSLHGPLDLVLGPEDINETMIFLKVLRQAARKTFHSCSIMRYLVIILTSLSQFDEALAAFETYIAYQEKARIRMASGSPSEENIGDTDKAVVTVFAKAIGVIVHVKNDGAYARRTADKLRGWLSDEPVISKTQSQHARKPSMASSTISASLSDSLGLVWAAIGRSYALYASQANTSEEREEVYELAVAAFENSIEHHPYDAHIYFDFALLLAETSQLDRSMKVVREGLMVDKQNVRLWHLIGLLLSAMEDYEKADQAIANALNMQKERAGVNLTGLASFEKTQYLQLKMTQAAIYEASYGIDKALESIPDVFTLYGELHAPTESQVPVPQIIEDQEVSNIPITPTKSRLFIKNIKPGLTKTLSRATFRDTRHAAAHTEAPPVPRLSNVSRMAPSSTSQVHTKASRKDLTALWLWTAGLYRRGGLYTDAEEAVSEAERVGGITADTQVELGLLLKPEQPGAALSEIESALEKDKDHKRAIIALAHLIYEQIELAPAKEDEVDSAVAHIANGINGIKLKSSLPTTSPATTSSPTVRSTDRIFISEQDRLAALTRAQGLLNRLLESGRGFNLSEGWYLMSLLKEHAGDKTGAIDALWKSVALEECRAVRSYGILAYEIGDFNA